MISNKFVFGLVTFSKAGNGLPVYIFKLSVAFITEDPS